MAMLKEVRVEVTEQAILPEGLPFCQSAHHVRQLFMHFLPARFTLDGSSLVQISCGPRDMKPEVIRVLGVTEVFVDFDFETYATADLRARELTMLETIRSTLNRIAAEVGAQAKPIDEAAFAVRQTDFSSEISVPKLSKKLAKLGIHVVVKRSISAMVGEVWILELRNSSGRVLRETDISPRPGYIDRREMYRSAKVQARTFQLVNRLGKEVFSVDLRELGVVV